MLVHRTIARADKQKLRTRLMIYERESLQEESKPLPFFEAPDVQQDSIVFPEPPGPPKSLNVNRVCCRIAEVRTEVNHGDAIWVNVRILIQDIPPCELADSN